MRLPTRHALGLFVLVSAGLVVVSCARARGPAAAPAQPQTATARNAACEGCHPDIAGEWRASLHRQSHTDPMYQRAFAREPLAFCTSCHAPEADAADPGPSAQHALGVSCVTCHEISGEHPNGGVRTAPHATASCAQCHEFAFPGTSELMQLTATEHRASPQADNTCASCHMPKVDTKAGHHASHRFDASRDATVIRSAARITAARAGSKVRFSFEPHRTGHAFPTGDLFRRLRLVAEVRAAGAPRRVESFLGRKTKRPDLVAGAGAVNAADDRPFVRGQPVGVDLEIGDAPGPITWFVVYERVEHPRSDSERDSVIEGAIDVASGSLE